MKLQVIILTLAALTMGSCIREYDAPVPEGGDDRSVRFSMSPPDGAAARSMGGADETAVATVDVLAFHDDGYGVYRYAYTAEEIRRNDMTVTARVKGYPSAQVFVVLVNASDELAAADISVNEPLEGAMRKLVCTRGAQGQWNARNNGSAVFDHIPMYAKTDPVVVDAEGKQIGTFPLIRMLARVDIRVADGVWDFRLTDARVYNQKTAGYVAYDFSGFGDGRASAAAVPEANTNTGDPVLAGTVVWPANDLPDPKGTIESSIYLYESPAYGEAEKLTGTAIVVGGEYGGVPGYWRINLKTTDDTDPSRLSSHILRNHLYHVEIQSVMEAGYETPGEAYAGANRLTATVTPWNLAPQKVADRQWRLSVDRDDLFFSGAAETAEIIAETDYDLSLQGFYPGLQIDPEAIRYISGGSGWLELNNVDGENGSLTRTIGVEAKQNLSALPRTATFDVKAGNLTKTIYVSQNFNISDGGNPLTKNTYVGAFWRADQTGERLINIKPGSAGNWSVAVYSYGDFKTDDIVFSTAPSSDPGVYGNNPADMNIPENDSKYNVSGNATSVSGTVASANDVIFFRIGLNTKWTPTSAKPARYAVIVVSHNGNSQKIWLRQGHADDYLLNNADGTRPNTRKFSPYNLTAAELTDTSPSFQLPINGGVFTAYPTQAGALFQFGSYYKRYAYNPANPNGSTSPWWKYTTSPFEDAQETCPGGYRRPIGGNTYDSEMIQSLRFNTERLGNAAWGYYADGFFDRRTPGKSPTHSAYTQGSPDSAVAIGTKDVAYIGLLFYNESTNASLFFPAPGMRDRESGYLTGPGSGGCYWTSTYKSLDIEGTGSVMGVGSYQASYGNFMYCSFAASLRCVKNE